MQEIHTQSEGTLAGTRHTPTRHPNLNGPRGPLASPSTRATSFSGQEENTLGGMHTAAEGERRGGSDGTDAGVAVDGITPTLSPVEEAAADSAAPTLVSNPSYEKTAAESPGGGGGGAACDGPCTNARSDSDLPTGAANAGPPCV